jgi:hypothetical protein
VRGEIGAGARGVEVAVDVEVDKGPEEGEPHEAVAASAVSRTKRVSNRIA